MTVIVKTSARIMIPLILIFGAATIIRGETTPGGGFQGGTIIAAAMTLYVVAFGLFLDAKRIRQMIGLISMGLSIIAFTALFGVTHNILFGFGHFMQNRGLFPSRNPGESFGAGTISVFGLGEGLHIASGFIAVILVFAVLMRLDAETHENRQRR